MSDVRARGTRDAGTGRPPALIRLTVVTLLVYVGTVVLIVSGAAPQPTGLPHASRTPRSSLARTAEQMARQMATSGLRHRVGLMRQGHAAPGGPARAETGTADAQAPTTARDGDRSGARRPGLQPLLDVADPRGDTGHGPSYADLTSLRLAGSSRGLRITVAVAGRPPSALVGHAVEGVGVDFYRSRADRSDYQVFLDGGSYGWRAFLHTPHGHSRFRGTFAVEGHRFVIDVPWAAVGGRRTAEVSVFADWSGGTGGSSTDRLPKKLLRIG